MGIFSFIGYSIFIMIGIWGFIIPSIKCAKNILRHNSADKQLPIQPTEIFALIIMPILGNVFLAIFKSDAELLDWNYIVSILLLTFASCYFYFISRTKKYITGPLTLVFIPSALTAGIVLALAQFIHFLPITLIGGALVASPMLFLSIFVFPALSLLQAAILLSAELHGVLQFNRKRIFQARNNNNDFLNMLKSFYFGKNYLIAQILTFPIYITVIQLILLVFSQKPDSIILAFIESSDGLFSQGKNDNAVHNPEYICTIAAFGSTKLVTPLHIGYRHGCEIRVTRQLKICNAFEEILAEKSPRMHRYLRTKYDNLQIPIEKWKNVKFVANALYILIKPLEWTFLFVIYLFDKSPETRIAKQYLPPDIYKPDQRLQVSF